MTRKKEIDRDQVLDAAEHVIVSSPGAALSRSMTSPSVRGISKGGLVYTFATKDELISQGGARARSKARFQEAVRQRLGDKPVPAFRTGPEAHIDEALDEDDAVTRKAAFLVTALVHAPDMMEPARRYYRTLLDPLWSKSGDASAVCHAFCWLSKECSCSWDWASPIFSTAEHRAVLLHARKMVVAVLAKRRK